MKDKINLKKLIKLAGHLIVILALAFVIKKIIDMDIKLSDLSSPRVIAAFAVSLVIQTAQILIGCWSWLLFTRSLSGQKIPYSAAMPVFTRSNIYKYLPGNVFQYVGRNQLAADMDRISGELTASYISLIRYTAVALLIILAVIMLIAQVYIVLSLKKSIALCTLIFPGVLLGIIFCLTVKVFPKLFTLFIVVGFIPFES